MKKIIFNIFTVFAVLLFCSGCKNRNAADKFYQRPSNAAEKQQDSDSSAPPPLLLRTKNKMIKNRIYRIRIRLIQLQV
ncbi:hypothetical protein [Treponema pedis]|uniref:Lipoprotein n=1 Tax=Treponema pedis str. T A4 TaxID=1291379 RepID=S6A4A1_9SPIR|nr:hypothetical protein [Treponema pedis]AGT44251.1 hypothetical protein TPE_1777 [Treponema pedis str. T A4]QSI04960.1 hypothetical protein DYQ05_08535 [Treponema pedis]